MQVVHRLDVALAQVVEELREHLAVLLQLLRLRRRRGDSGRRVFCLFGQGRERCYSCLLRHELAVEVDGGVRQRAVAVNQLTDELRFRDILLRDEITTRCADDHAPHRPHPPLGTQTSR